jgi:hypothetical protein
MKNNLANQDNVANLLRNAAAYITDASQFTINDRLDLITDLTDLVEYIETKDMVLLSRP